MDQNLYQVSVSYCLLVVVHRTNLQSTRRKIMISIFDLDFILLLFLSIQTTAKVPRLHLPTRTSFLQVVAQTSSSPWLP